MKQQTSAEIFLDFMNEVCPLSPEDSAGIYEAKANMPKQRPKAATNIRMREKNKIQSDMDHRFSRLAKEAMVEINIHESSVLDTPVVQYKLPMDNPFRLGIYLQLFYIMPWKEYCLFFPSPWLRNIPNRTKLMSNCPHPEYLLGRQAAVRAYRKIFHSEKKDILPSFDTLSDYGIQVDQYLQDS